MTLIFRQQFQAVRERGIAKCRGRAIKQPAASDWRHQMFELQPLIEEEEVLRFLYA